MARAVLREGKNDKTQRIFGWKYTPGNKNGDNHPIFLNYSTGSKESRCIFYEK